MTQEFDYKGFPYEVLGDGTPGSGDPVDKKAPESVTSRQTEPISVSSPSTEAVSPFYQSIKAQIADGKIAGASDEWVLNNARDITTKNGFTQDEIDSFNRLHSIVQNRIPLDETAPTSVPSVEPLIPGIEDEIRVVTDIGGAVPGQKSKEREVPTSAGSASTENKAKQGGKSWSMPYEVAKQDSIALGEIIDAWRSGDVALTRQLIDEHPIGSGVEGEMLSPSELVGLKRQLDIEIGEMEQAAEDFVLSSPDYANASAKIKRLTEDYTAASTASERKEIKEKIYAAISGAKLVGAYVLAEAADLANEKMRAKLDGKKKEFIALRRSHETTHEEVLAMVLRDKEFNFEDEVRARSPIEQYRFINHLLVELEEGEKGSTLDQVNYDLKQQLLKIEGWVANSRAEVDQPMDNEVAKIVEARLNLDHTYKLINKLNLKHPDYGNQLNSKDFDRLVETRRLLTPEQSALLFGWVDNGLGIPFDEVFSSFERIALQRQNRSAQEASVEWDLQVSSKRDRIKLFRAMEIAPGQEPISDDDMSTNILLAQRAAIVWGLHGQADFKCKTQLGKLIHTWEARVAAQKKASGAGGDFGPDITIDRILSIATDAMRFAKIDGEFIFAPELFKQAVDLAIQGNAKDAAKIVYGIMSVVPGAKSNLYWGDKRPNIVGLPENHIREYWTTQIKAAVELGSQILNNKWVPGDLGSDVLQTMRGNIAKIDPTISYMADKRGIRNPSGALSLARQVYIGITDASLKEGVDPRESTVQGWLDEGQLGNLDNRIVDSGFLDQNGLDGVYKTVNFESRITAARAKQPGKKK